MSEKKLKLLVYMAVLSAGTLLISNLAAIKLWDFFGIAVDGGLVLFPLTYVLGDLCVEFFGKRISRNIIWAGFLINIIAVIVYYIVIVLPPFPGWDMQEAYALVLGFSPRIVAGSLLGYTASNLFNNKVFVSMKESDSIFARSFIARALGSSAFARILDSAIFETVAFLGVLPLQDFIAQALFAYGAGMALEVILSPAEAWLERKLKHYADEPQT